jgi:4-amino-4-deoxy-L-arabinose transferase
MNNNIKFLMFLSFLLFFLLARTYYLPIFEPTEGVHAEIAREMLVNKNYLEPTLNGVKHIYSTPLAYWGMALGMKLFGVNGFGVRFFGIIMALIAILATYKTAQLFKNNQGFDFNSSVVLSSSLLFLICSLIVSADIYLTTFSMLALYFLFRQIFYYKNLTNSLLYALFLGFGFLTKGPTIFVFTLLPYLLCKCFLKSHRKVFSSKDIILSLLLFIFIAIPWCIFVMVRNPGLLDYFMHNHINEQILMGKFEYNKPIYFYLIVFICTFIPYIIYFLKGFFNLNQFATSLKILYLYILIPLLFFSLIKIKVATYILPFYGLASIISYFVISIERAKLYKTFSYCFLLFFHISAFFSFSIKFNIKNSSLELQIFLSLWLVSIVVLTLLYFIFYEKLLFNASLSIFVFVMFACLILPLVRDELGSYKSLTEKINSIDPEKKYEVLVFNNFLPSISFYRDKLAITAFSKEKNLDFENEKDYKNYYIKTLAQ